MDKQKTGKRIRSRKWLVNALLLVLYDLIAIYAAFFLALWIRFDCRYLSIPAMYLQHYLGSISISAVVTVALGWMIHVYRSVWRYASYSELVRTLFAAILGAVVHCVLVTVLGGRMPQSYYLWGSILQILLMVIPRFSLRLLMFFADRLERDRELGGRVMLIGAGSAGQMLLRDINRTRKIHDKVVCIIDDDPKKWYRYIEGVPVVGGRDEILLYAEKYKVNKIYLAIPSASAADRREILDICDKTSCELKQLPGLFQLVLGQVTVSDMKDVSVEDLLGREPIRTDMEEVYDFINGKVVLVTGGGGSIGSELCRQIAAHAPRQLIIFDVYENNAYDIQLELKERYPDLDLVTLIGSVRDSRRMFQVFEYYRPQIVYHAAAHKHVPLMEDSPNEAIKNNAIGTYKTAYAAMVHGCERFVLISTDKAVNPTNIMGASKRLCEMIIQSFDAKIRAGRAAEIPQLFTHGMAKVNRSPISPEEFRRVKTQFVAVRFGNVLGSNGSVIPIFKRQIQAGGPVTVTHPDIIRYFMTIPEAVSLVMLAGTYAQGGEILVLDMGSPVKIDTLARNLIRLSGFRPDVDIKIEYTGLRPGEKLYEEKLMAEEGLRKTQNDLIHVGCPIPFDTDRFLAQLEDLMNDAYQNRRDIRVRVAEMVSTYHPIPSETEAEIDSRYLELVSGGDQ